MQEGGAEPERPCVLVTLKGLALWQPAGLSRDPLREAYRPDWLALHGPSRSAAKAQQPLVKALASRGRRSKALTVLDAMGGFGEDAWLMACLGHRVVVVERCAAVFALLRDAWARAGVIRPGTARRIRPLRAEAAEVLEALEQRFRQGEGSSGASPPGLPHPEVVYLDPMFPGPERRKSAERKAMRLLRRLLGPEEARDGELLRQALRTAADRVVVKRPLRAEPFRTEALRPVHSVPGRSVRYDVYLPGPDSGPGFGRQP